MAQTNLFLAGVANAEVFDGDQLFISARTLIDSSITIGVTLEEIRGGMGNALWGKFAHTSTFDLKITDAMFNLEYLAANVGSDISMGGDVFKDEELTSDGAGEITLSATAVPVRTNGTTYAYIRPASQGGAKRTAYLVTEDNKVTGLVADTKYCVRYMYTDGAARKMVVNSNFIPGTFSIVLTANLYAGDACNADTATKVGTLTIKVPRFQLNGNQELTMSASGVSNTSFEGSALASGCTGCDDNGVYAEIIETIFNSYWYSDASGLIIEDSYIELAQAADFEPFTPTVYAWYPTGAPKQISNAILTAQETGLTSDEKTKLVFSITAGTTGLSIDASTGAITGTAAAGTALVTVEAQKNDGTPIPGMDASMTIVIAA